MLGNTLNDSRARKRGRPIELSTAEREAAILDSAEVLLAETGIKGASMAAIAKAAGMSKRTLYEVFPSRAALFEACIRRIRLSLIRPLDGKDSGLPLKERLLKIFEPEARNADLTVPSAIVRAVINEAHNHPELGQIFMREGPMIARAAVRDEITRAIDDGEIALSNPMLGAEMLCDMVFENPIDRLVEPDRAPRTAQQAQDRLRLAIDVFLNGCAAEAC